MIEDNEVFGFFLTTGMEDNRIDQIRGVQHPRKYRADKVIRKPREKQGDIKARVFFPLLFKSITGFLCLIRKEDTLGPGRGKDVLTIDSSLQTCQAYRGRSERREARLSVLYVHNVNI